jgi:hypothetical protein
LSDLIGVGESLADFGSAICGALWFPSGEFVVNVEAENHLARRVASGVADAEEKMHGRGSNKASDD